MGASQKRVKSLVRSEREVSGKLAESQREPICLQGELIAKKDEDLQKVRSGRSVVECGGFRQKHCSEGD